MRERLLSDVRARLEQFAELQDPAVVLDPRALEEVAALLEVTPDLGADLAVAHAAGCLHWCRYLVLDDDQEDLAAALRLLEPVYRALPDAVPDQVRAYLDAGGPALASEVRAAALSAARLLEDVFRTGDRHGLDHGIDLLRQTLDIAPAAHPDKAGMLSIFGAALRRRFELTGELADLERAVAAGWQAVKAIPVGHPGRGLMLYNLGGTLQRQFEQSGELADLEAAITAGRQAVDVTPADHPNRAAMLSNLCHSLRVRSEQKGDLADLEAAITAGRQAVGAAPAGRPDRARMLANLGAAQRARFGRLGELADLEAAITAAREAIAATPVGHPDRAGMLSDLQGALRARFERMGERADLDAAIIAGQESVNATPVGHPDRATRLSNLAGALHARFERTGERTDLDEAVAAARDAVATAPADHPDRATRLSNLGVTLQVRSERTGSQADLDEAVAAARDAVAATATDHPVRTGMLASLARARVLRSERTGSQADLDEAVAAARDAVAATPTDHPDHATWLSSLGAALLARFERTRLTTDLDEAITATRDAVAANPVGHPDRVGMLANLGLALAARFSRTRVLADLDAAVSAWREAATVPGASPRWQARAAGNWGFAAAAGGQWPEAVAGFEAAVGLLGLVAPRSLARGDQEHLLTDLGDLASHAAACCVRVGRTDRAFELFEQGRGILLGQALDTRTDLTTLAEQHPDLARRFTELRDDLDRADGREYPVRPHPEASSAQAKRAEAPRQEAERRRETAQAFDSVIASIRATPGFVGFLRPPPARDLAAAAAGGPVVIVNPSQFGSHALILTSGGAVEPVLLDDLTAERVEREVTGLLSALDDPLTAQMTLTATLGWLWDAIAGPVLDRLGFAGPPLAGEAWPRLWWCLPGLLSFLPLHAAGHHDTRSDACPQTVADRVVSSYTPTIRALLHARRADLADGAGSRSAESGDDILLVAMPTTPGADDLPGALAEADQVCERFADGRARTLVGPDATYATVTGALARARWAHFACHGTADPADPSASRLLLHDHLQQPLTVIDVARLRLEDADLAFLSACSTARPGTRLADEAIHLASAFQLAGYRHVIGTLWPVIDKKAADIADAVYDALAGAETASGVAVALHTITRQLRDKSPRTPTVWASHIHSGP